MKKESRVVLTEEQHAFLTVAASRAGMPLATYLRYCAMQNAATLGVYTQPPRAD